MILTNEDLRSIAKLLEPIQADLKETKEDVQVLKEDVQVLKEDVQVLKEDVQVLKEDVQVLKEDVQVLKEDVQGLKEDVQILNEKVDHLDHRVTSLELKFENEVNRNIRILAENHSVLIDKLNQSIDVADKNRIYAVNVNYLNGRVDKLETDVIELKKRSSVNYG